MYKLNTGNLDQITLKSRQGAPFIPLGKIDPIETQKDDSIIKKIKGQTRDMVDTVWGTLGMADDTLIKMTGDLEYSKKGSKNSKPEKSGPAALEEIKLFYQGRSKDINDSELKTVTERFISFENVTFKNYPKVISSYDKIPKLRLTLYLQPDEGALVFYQFNRSAKEGEIEYIQPLPTQNHSCSDRDRLTYHIPIFPPKAVQHDESNKRRGFFQNDKTQPVSMLIKVLTGKRDNSESDTILKKLHYHVFGHTHQLLQWKNQNNQFEPIDKSDLDTSIDKPLLFLIHGTFSNTDNAFNGLIEGAANSWISQVARNGKYKKIIAFDHPTIGEGPEENANALIERIPVKFKAPTNIITHSRGGLLGKYIGQNLPQFVINRGALVACANGVGYFTAGWGVAKLLTAMKKMLSKNSPILALVAGVAQHSAEWFLKQPGCRAMTPGSDLLNEILTRKNPLPLKYSRFLPIVGDYTPALVKNKPFWKRAGMNGLDFSIKFILGWKHDWVVGSNAQKKVAPGRFSREFKNQRGKIYPARHSDYFYDPKVKNIIIKFIDHTPSY